jgi:predicted ATPase
LGAVMGIWTPLTSFVGRTADVAGVTGLLTDSRLVTVTGPGGVGKTRLAIEAARRAADQFPDGAYLVGLATVADEAQVPTEVMAALGVQQDPGRPAPRGARRGAGARGGSPSVRGTPRWSRAW